MTANELCAYFDLMTCHRPPNVPLLPARCPRPRKSQWFGVGQLVRIPLDGRILNIRAVDQRESDNWYAVDLMAGCRKWYSETELLALRPQQGDLVRYRGRVAVVKDSGWLFDLLTGKSEEVVEINLALDGIVLVRDFWTPGPVEQRQLDRLRRLDERADCLPVERLRTVEAIDHHGETVYRVEMSA